MKTICHVHTTFSFDSMIHPAKLITYAEKLNIGILLICDHDNFEGARQARKYTIENGIKNIFIPIAAEVKTEYGDVIVVFNDDEKLNISELKTFNSLVSRTRSEGGIIILPHPFVNHKEVGNIAKEVDCIEVFNSRCSTKENQDALDMCLKLNKFPFYGSDAHLYSELNNVVVSYRAVNDKYPFLSHPIVMVQRRTPIYKIRVSVFIKAFKKRNYLKMIVLLLAATKWVIIERIRKPIFKERNSQI